MEAHGNSRRTANTDQAEAKHATTTAGFGARALTRGAEEKKNYDARPYIYKSQKMYVRDFFSFFLRFLLCVFGRLMTRGFQKRDFFF
jgi:hypothetical protein